MQSMSTHTHPALQAVLRESNVRALIRYIDADRPELHGKGGDSLDYLDGYRDAQTAAIRAVRMVWKSAVIATHAHALDLEDQAEADAASEDETGGYPADGDALNIYRQTAGDLLALAVRLDLADQRDVDARAAALESLAPDDEPVPCAPDELDEEM